MWLVVAIVIIVVIIAIAANANGNGSASPDNVALLFSHFEKVRNEYHGGKRNCRIVIGSPITEYNGTSILTAFLSVYVPEEDNSGAERARNLGMQSKFRDNKYEHHLVIREKFSKSAKQAIIQEVVRQIRQTYPNDFVTYDDKLPMSMVITDMKDFIETMHSNTK